MVELRAASGDLTQEHTGSLTIHLVKFTREPNCDWRWVGVGR